MATVPKTLLVFAFAFAIASSAVVVPVSASSSGGASRPAKAVTITLYGSATAGWGFGPGNMTSPGPPIAVDQGDVITFTLFSADSTPHTLVIDLNANGGKNADDVESGTFLSPSTGFTFTYTANVSGTQQYFCGLHGPNIMKGPFTVRAAPAPPGDNTLLIVGGVIAVVVVIAGATAAMRMRKKQPPQQPPQP